MRVDDGKVVGESPPKGESLVESLARDVWEASGAGQWLKALKRWASMRRAAGLDASEAVTAYTPNHNMPKIFRATPFLDLKTPIPHFRLPPEDARGGRVHAVVSNQLGGVQSIATRISPTFIAFCCKVYRFWRCCT